MPLCLVRSVWVVFYSKPTGLHAHRNNCHPMAQPLLSTAHEDCLSTRQIVLKYRSGSIFDNAPAETLFAHSCNCRGVWGKGVALDFHRRYSRAYDTYRSLCNAVEARGLLGKAAVILPSEVGIPSIPMRHHHVACLFVKDTPGKPRDGKEKGEIFEATALAMQQLLDGLARRGDWACYSFRRSGCPKSIAASSILTGMKQLGSWSV